jgi:cephalosporin hydroxylase
VTGKKRFVSLYKDTNRDRLDLNQVSKTIKKTSNGKIWTKAYSSRGIEIVSWTATLGENQDFLQHCRQKGIRFRGSLLWSAVRSAGKGPQFSVLILIAIEYMHTVQGKSAL